MADGLLDLLGGALGTTPPAYLQGLLGENAVEDLRKRSIGSGLVNALIGYAAAPKNQNLGLGRILAGAAQSGIQGAQGVYQNATQDYMMQQRIADAQRKQDQQTRLQTMLGGITDPNDRLLAELNPEAYVANKLKPVQRKTFVAPDGSIRFEDTGEIANQTNVAAPKDVKALPTYEVQRGRTKYTVQVQPDGTEKIIGQGSMDAPKDATIKPLYGSTPTDTSSGLVYMPTPDGLKAGYKPISAATGKPVEVLLSKEQQASENIKQKQKARETSQVIQADKVINKVDSALKNVSYLTTGTGKDFTPEILESSTGATDLQSELDTIKANLGFAELAAMREASPTGGALGSIAVQELEMLQSTVASLSTRQTPEQLRQNLSDVKMHYENWKNTLDGATPPKPTVTPPAAAISALKADPKRKADFDAKYGAGASKKYLGN